jgi:nitrite reductase/ring-hydroxylating ferredoxin subunit
MPSEQPTAKSTSRREFLQNSCSALAILSLTSGGVIIAGCDSGGSSSSEDTLPEGVTRDGNTLIVDLEAFPDLQTPNNSLWIPAADIIVIHGPDVGYRAFSSICPHEGEDVSIFEPSGGASYQLRCPAHDWTFDVDGDPTGSARADLNRYSVTKEGATLQITR